MVMWQPVVEVALTSLLSCLVVVLAAVFLRFVRKDFYETLLGRKSIAVFLLVSSILLVPIVFSLSKGTLLSPEVMAVYVRELVVSVIFVVSFVGTWKVLNNSAAVLRPFEAIYETAKQAIISLTDAQATGALAGLPVEIPSLNDALLAWDHNELSQDEVREFQLLESLRKWMWQEDETGWYELQEEIGPGNRLQCLGARLIVEWELRRVQQEGHRTGGHPSRNGKYERQLQSLLSSLETPSLNEALLAWDRDEISQDRVREVQLLEALKKWLWDEDNTGWYELQEEIDFGNRLQHLEVRLIVERELWRVQQEGHRTDDRPSRSGEYEKQLQSLLSPQLV